MCLTSLKSWAALSNTFLSFSTFEPPNNVGLQEVNPPKIIGLQKVMK
jgi:hypothetical protein